VASRPGALARAAAPAPDRWAPGGPGAAAPAGLPGAPPWARAARRSYSRKEAVAIYLTLKRAAALALPRGVDRGDASLFAEAGQARAPPRRRPRDPTRAAFCECARYTLVRAVSCALRLFGLHCVPCVRTARGARAARHGPVPCVTAGRASERACLGRPRSEGAAPRARIAQGPQPERRARC
jgi:hypothetical protein